MDFARIQKYVVERGDKCVIVENDEPVMVVMSFRDYENLSGLAHGTNGAPPKAARRDNAMTLPSRRDEWQTPDVPETEFIVERVSEEESIGFPLPSERRQQRSLTRGTPRVCTSDTSSDNTSGQPRGTFIPEDPPPSPPPLAHPRLDEIRLEDLPL